MSKNYEVLITAYAIVLVKNAENEEEALTEALDDVDMGSFQHNDSRIEKEIPDSALEQEERRAKSHGYTIIDLSE